MTTSPTGLRAGLDERLRAVRGVVFDVDGCLVLSDKPGGHSGTALPGAVEAVAAVRASGRRVVAFTNGSSQVPADIAAGLRDLGFDLADDEVLTPAVVAAETVRQRYGDRPVLAFGGAGLLDVLVEHGVMLGDLAKPAEAAAVVIGWDTEFVRDRLQAAAEAVWSGAPMLVMSDARRFASATRPMVGVGGFIARGLSYVTGTDYEVLGKPSPTAMAVACHRLGVPAEKVLVAGDDLSLEVAMARAADAVGALVVTGIHSRADAEAAVPAQRPDLVVDRLEDLVERLLAASLPE